MYVPSLKSSFYSSLEKEDYDVVVDGLNVACGGSFVITNNKDRQDRVIKLGVNSVVLFQSFFSPTAFGNDSEAARSWEDSSRHWKESHDQIRKIPVLGEAMQRSLVQ